MNTNSSQISTALERTRIRQEYDALKHTPYIEVVAIYKSLHKVSDTRGVGKIALITDILIAEHGQRRYKEAFETKKS